MQFDFKTNSILKESEPHSPKKVSICEKLDKIESP